MKKMRRQQIIYGGLAAGFLLLFVAFTLVVKFVDADQVGLAHLNNFFWTHLGSSAVWQSVTDWLGYVTLLLAVGVVGAQLVQLIKRKSLRQVDRNLWVFDLIGVLLVAVYVFFELVVVNYRPPVDPSVLKASYPSTHAMLFATILPLVIWQVWHYLKNKPARIVFTLLLSAMLAVGLVGRMLSGVHWFTDIVGGVMISVALNCLYGALTDINTKEQL